MFLEHQMASFIGPRTASMDSLLINQIQFKLLLAFIMFQDRKQVSSNRSNIAQRRDSAGYILTIQLEGAMVKMQRILRNKFPALKKFRI